MRRTSRVSRQRAVRAYIAVYVLVALAPHRATMAPRVADFLKRKIAAAGLKRGKQMGSRRSAAAAALREDDFEQSQEAHRQQRGFKGLAGVGSKRNGKRGNDAVPLIAADGRSSPVDAATTSGSSSGSSSDSEKNGEASTGGKPASVRTAPPKRDIRTPPTSPRLTACSAPSAATAEAAEAAAAYAAASPHKGGSGSSSRRASAEHGTDGRDDASDSSSCTGSANAARGSGKDGNGPAILFGPVAFGCGTLTLENVPDLNLPRLSIKMVKKPMNTPSVQALLNAVDGAIAYGEPFTILFDVRSCSLPGRAQINLARDWSRRNWETLDAMVQGIAVVLSSVMVRSTVNMLIAMARPAQPVGIFSNERDAHHFARDKCKVARVWTTAAASSAASPAASAVPPTGSDGSASDDLAENAVGRGRSNGRAEPADGEPGDPSLEDPPSMASPALRPTHGSTTESKAANGTASSSASGARAGTRLEYSTDLVGDEMGIVELDACTQLPAAAGAPSGEAPVHVHLQPWGGRRPIILASRLASRLRPAAARQARREQQERELEHELRARDKLGGGPSSALIGGAPGGGRAAHNSTAVDTAAVGCGRRLLFRLVCCGGGAGRSVLEDEHEDASEASTARDANGGRPRPPRRMPSVPSLDELADKFHI